MRILNKKLLRHLKGLHALLKNTGGKLFRLNRMHRNLIFFFGGVGVLIIGTSMIWFASLKIPDFRSFEGRKVSNSTKIYDRTGEVLLYDIYKDVKKTEIPLEKMSDNIKKATIAIEDAEFYNHSGIRVKSIIRATLSNLFGFGIGGGGSTITQQLIKNTLLTSEKGFDRYVRKIKEWVLAVKIERTMSKDKILEYYLNESPYGGTIYGIEEASKTYFGKSASNLSLTEAAYLASIPQSPTRLSPYGKNRDKLDARKNLVLSRMLELKMITADEYETARNKQVEFVPQEAVGIKAPHFVFFVKDYLEKKYGEEMVEKGGLKVITTLDYSLEEKAEKLVKEGALENEKNWGGNNASLVAIDPRTGQILTMVGSRDFFDKNIDGNYNVATALRQPGSSFKPFIYATAFGKGFTPETVLFDLPTEFQTTCDPSGKALHGKSQNDCYMPDNYDGKFRGPISLRDALAQSINVIAVKLFYLAGLDDSLKTAESMGISTLSDIERYGLTLVIGGGEVTLLEITSAYGVFAQNGVHNPYTSILKIEDKDGIVLEEYTPNAREVLDKNIALTVSDVLSDNKARTPTFGQNSALVINGREVAVKTGTTNSNKDAWTIGYTPSIVVGVWAGNNDNTPMKKGGVSMAGPIWNKFITEALKGSPVEYFEKPIPTNELVDLKPVLRGFWQGNESFLIDKISGKLATEWTPKETIEEKVVTNVHSILYWVDKKDILGEPPSSPERDPQFNNWEKAVEEWWNNNKESYKAITMKDIPGENDDVHTEESGLFVEIIEPKDESSYKKNEVVNLKVQSGGPSRLPPLVRVDVFINNAFVESLSAPFQFSFIPNEIESIEKENELRVIAYDANYNRGENSIIFTIKK